MMTSAKKNFWRGLEVEDKDFEIGKLPRETAVIPINYLVRIRILSFDLMENSAKKKAKKLLIY